MCLGKTSKLQFGEILEKWKSALAFKLCGHVWGCFTQTSGHRSPPRSPREDHVRGVKAFAALISVEEHKASSKGEAASGEHQKLGARTLLMQPDVY